MLVHKFPAAILNTYQIVVMKKEFSNVSNVPCFTKKSVENPTHLKIACCFYAESSAYNTKTPNPELKNIADHRGHIQSYYPNYRK
jgi:hypothetical protein